MAIWGSDEFRALSPAAQHLYFVLAASPTLNYAGVADWRPKRIASLSSGWSARAVEEAASELSRAGTIVVDEDTEEVLIRTWIKHDGLVNQERMAVSVASAYGGIASARLRGVIVHELKRLRDQQPDLRGWSKPQLAHVLEQASVDPKPYSDLAQTELRLGANATSIRPKPKSVETPDLPQNEVELGANQTSATPAPAPATTPSSGSLLHADSDASAETGANGDSGAAQPRREYPADFEEFWAEYPIKRDKGKALKAYRAARKRASQQALTDGARRYRDDPNREDQFTKYAEGWLNAGGWEDEPLPERRGPTTFAQAKANDTRDFLTRWGPKDGEEPWNAKQLSS